MWHESRSKNVSGINKWEEVEKGGEEHIEEVHLMYI